MTGPLPTELQKKLSKMLKVTYLIMIMYYVTPMIPLYNGFYLFPLSRAVNSNRLIFDPSEFKIGLYMTRLAISRHKKTSHAILYFEEN